MTGHWDQQEVQDHKKFPIVILFLAVNRVIATHQLNSHDECSFAVLGADIWVSSFLQYDANQTWMTFHDSFHQQRILTIDKLIQHLRFDETLCQSYLVTFPYKLVDYSYNQGKIKSDKQVKNNQKTTKK